MYDLMCQDHKFLEWHAAQKKYGLAGKDVIPKVVDLQIKMFLACDINIRGSLTSICKISVKTVYDLLLEPNLKKPASKHYPKYA